MSVQSHPYAGDNNNPVDAVNNEILLLSGREVGALLEDQEIKIRLPGLCSRVIAKRLNL